MIAKEQMSLVIRKIKSAVRFYHRQKHPSADWALALSHVFDLAKLYLTRPSDEIAYYNLLFSIAIAARPTVILELGTGPGLSSLAFIRVLQYMRKTGWAPQAVLHSCDINPASLDSLGRFADLVVPHVVQTDQLAALWTQYSIRIDLLYIDADHSHAQSLADLQHFAPWVVPNGLILMHDTFPKTEDDEAAYASGTAWKTARYVKEHCLDEFEIMTIPYLAGLSLLRKRGAKYF